MVIQYIPQLQNLQFFHLVIFFYLSVFQILLTVILLCCLLSIFMVCLWKAWKEKKKGRLGRKRRKVIPACVVLAMCCAGNVEAVP